MDFFRRPVLAHDANHDPTFNGQNIYVYHYPSPRLSRTLSIDELADNMRLVLTTDGVLRHRELTFVSHSMGGVVTRDFILKYRDVVPKNSFAVLLCNTDHWQSLRGPR
jgi:pimeloyl-ACP methyl ester carboxylesterase